MEVLVIQIQDALSAAVKTHDGDMIEVLSKALQRVMSVYQQGE